MACTDEKPSISQKYSTPAFASGMFDMIRWMAATMVLLCHARSMFYGSYSDIRNPSILDTALYSVTLFWHAAVIVFFVLSGYFIGSSVLKSMAENRFCWKHYLINRLTRLYVVLVPVLIFTAALDWLGMHLWGTMQHGYDLAQSRSTLTIWLGSLLMFQPIYCHPFGTNAPLWSLSYEFWYYLLFPTLAISISKTASTRIRLKMAVICFALLSFIQIKVAAYSLVWLLGVLVAVLPCPAKWTSRRWAFPATCLVVPSGVIFIRILERTIIPVDAYWGLQFCTDLILASLIALFIYAARAYSLTGKSRPFPLAKMHKELAGFSYTTYLIHLPILVFISAGAFIKNGEPLGPDRLDILWFGCLIAFVFTCAYGFSLVTERRTDTIRKRIRRIVE